MEKFLKVGWADIALFQTDGVELVEGTNEEGRWMGSWITKNISARATYSTIFEAKNKEGKESKMYFYWQAEK